jgi:ABC-type polysaccharide/polyol phosphate export permease
VSLFYLILAGGSYFSINEVDFKGKIEVLLVNYFLWTLAISTISSIPQQVEEDAKAGTLELLLQSVYPAPLLFFVRGLTSTVYQIIISVLIISILVLTTGVMPNVKWGIIFSIVSVIFCSLGISLFLGGLGIIVKRVAIFTALLQLPLLFLLTFPFENRFSDASFQWWLLLPFTADSMQARLFVSDDFGKIELYLYSGICSLAWLAGGFASFTAMLRYTKKNASTIGY